MRTTSNLRIVVYFFTRFRLPLFSLPTRGGPWDPIFDPPSPAQSCGGRPPFGVCRPHKARFIDFQYDVDGSARSRRLCPPHRRCRRLARQLHDHFPVGQPDLRRRGPVGR
jgi:hypothetical protein